MKFKTSPYAHQLKAFELFKDSQASALLMEPGCGKSKVALDIAAYQFEKGIIDAVLIVAPNGVHSNWLINEIPTHLSVSSHSILWKRSEKFKKEFMRLVKRFDDLIIFSINIDAIATEEGKKWLKSFFTWRKVLFILDESSRIKTPSALRTKTAINFGKLATSKIILTGTPVTQSPFDLYARFKFLDEGIWGQTFTSFKHEYGIFEQRMNYAAGKSYDKLITYKNLDKLQSIIARQSFRVTKKDCLDLPEKIYQRYTVELSPSQRRHYEEIKTDLITQIRDTEVTAPIVLTQLLRLQQITGGFITVNDTVVPVCSVNPKLALLGELVEERSKVIIWARFSSEIKAIAALLKSQYGESSTVEYWGNISQKDREKAVYDFQNNVDTRFFVGNAHAGGIGLTLTAASTMIYYSNDFSLETRVQSEDRAHRIGQRQNVLYIDIEALNTIDKQVIDALRQKKNLADLITGDRVAEWL